MGGNGADSLQNRKEQKMKTKIYSLPDKRFIAVRFDHPLPDGWEEARLCRTLELSSKVQRFGIRDMHETIDALKQDGHVELGTIG